MTSQTINTATLDPQDREALASIYDQEIAEARTLLVRAIEEKGADYIYPRSKSEQCLYQEYEIEDEWTSTEDGEKYVKYANPTGPSCIVGHVAYYKGIDPKVLLDFEGSNASNMIRQAEMFTSIGVREALTAAQTIQDEGGTWGDALREFDYFVARNGNIDRPGIW